MEMEHRFAGALSEDYQLLSLAMLHFEELQARVAQAVCKHTYPGAGTQPVLEIGFGSGVTSDAILSSRADLHLTALDSEEKMLRLAESNLAGWIGAGRCRLVQAGALEFLREQPDAGFEVVASALTLHNMPRAYRTLLHAEIYRVLRPGGLLVNADKYAPQDQAERFACLGVALGRFFDAFVPLGKLDLLREWVLHNLADQGPERAMLAEDTLAELAGLGFSELRLGPRWNMEALLVGRKG